MRSCATLMVGAKQIEEQNAGAGLKKVRMLNQDSGPCLGAGSEDVSDVTPSMLGCMFSTFR